MRHSQSLISLMHTNITVSSRWGVKQTCYSQHAPRTIPIQETSVRHLSSARDFSKDHGEPITRYSQSLCLHWWCTGYRPHRGGASGQPDGSATPHGFRRNASQREKFFYDVSGSLLRTHSQPQGHSANPRKNTGHQGCARIDKHPSAQVLPRSHQLLR